VSSKFEFIEAEKAFFPIVKMCAWLEVSRSGFYEWRERPLSATAARRAEITAMTVDLFDEFEQRYGYRKLRVELTERGVPVSEWLVRQIMAEQGLECCHPRPWRATTDPDGSDGPADLLGGDFTAERPGDRFVGDITYIRTGSGWWYLSTVIDLYNREVVGYAMASHLRASLVTDAVDLAVMRGLVNRDAVFHSDRGSQYTSRDMADCLAGHEMRGSMGRTGVCWDNAVAESFFATLKKELVHRTLYPNHQIARHEIAKYIEDFYNRRRIHSWNGYTTPLEARQAWENTGLAS
jgi:transposase InsO family protein